MAMRLLIGAALLCALPALGGEWLTPGGDWRSPPVGPVSDMWELARQHMALEEQRRRMEFDRSLEIQRLEREHRFRIERLQHERQIESLLREREIRLQQRAPRERATPE